MLLENVFYPDRMLDEQGNDFRDFIESDNNFYFGGIETLLEQTTKSTEKFKKAFEDAFALKNAKEVMVPEYNRACILRVWEKLKKTPTVVPNKPLFHPLQRNIQNPYSDQLEGKKIILYQGYIQRSRNIDTVCEAVKDMPDYTVVMMGKGDQTYIDELTSKYPHIIHISFCEPK